MSYAQFKLYMEVYKEEQKKESYEKELEKTKEYILRTTEIIRDLEEDKYLKVFDYLDTKSKENYDLVSMLLLSLQGNLDLVPENKLFYFNDVLDGVLDRITGSWSYSNPNQDKF